MTKYTERAVLKYLHKKGLAHKDVYSDTVATPGDVWWDLSVTCRALKMTPITVVTPEILNKSKVQAIATTEIKKEECYLVPSTRFFVGQKVAFSFDFNSSSNFRH